MLNTITSGPADISMVAVKFAESVVLACVGGRGLAPGASREGDKSVQRDLSPSHPFLLADTLDQAGHALARQMVGWLGNSSAGAGGAAGAKGGTGWGSGFGAQHYSVLINALQNLATNRAALFADIVPAFAAALESVNRGGVRDGRGKSSAAAPAAPAGVVTVAPKGLQDAASSLRSACLRLLKVAPASSRNVQRLATAAALSGSDGEAKAAVEGNSSLRGRIKLPARPRERPKTSRAGTLDHRSGDRAWAWCFVPVTPRGVPFWSSGFGVAICVHPPGVLPSRGCTNIREDENLGRRSVTLITQLLHLDRMLFVQTWGHVGMHGTVAAKDARVWYSLNVWNKCH